MWIERLRCARRRWRPTTPRRSRRSGRAGGGGSAGAGPGDGDGNGRGGLSLTAVVRGLAAGATAFFLVEWRGHPQHPPLLASAVVGFGGVATLDDVRVPAGARRWSPARPALHELTLTLLREPAETAALSCAEDAMTVRVGLRRIGVTGRSVTLDGAPLKLKGFNRHEPPTMAPRCRTRWSLATCAG